MVQKTRAAINTRFKIRYHKRQSSSVLLLVLSILCSLISRLLSDISVPRIYILYARLRLSEFSPACNFQCIRTTLYFFQTLELICSFTALPSTVAARVQFSHFCASFALLLFSFFFEGVPHSFTHAVAFLLVARPRTRDIRRVLIMLLDRWPLSSPFHKIPARGGTTYYVPGPSVPSHTRYSTAIVPIEIVLMFVALKRGDSGVNFSARVKGALKSSGGLNSVVDHAQRHGPC